MNGLVHLLCNSIRTNTTLATRCGFHKYHYVPLQDLQPQNWVLACICVNPVQTIETCLWYNLFILSLFNIFVPTIFSLDHSSILRMRATGVDEWLLEVVYMHLEVVDLLFDSGLLCFVLAFFSPPTWFFYASGIVLYLCLKTVDIWSKQ